VVNAKPLADTTPVGESKTPNMSTKDESPALMKDNQSTTSELNQEVKLPPDVEGQVTTGSEVN
jgi:hypothetical protein